MIIIIIWADVTQADFGENSFGDDDYDALMYMVMVM